MILNYFSLGVLVFVFIVIFYGIIIVHDIPYMIAKNRNHPHADAIHVAGWVSLFTLHIIWPMLWIWATLYNPERGWGMREKNKQEYYDINLQALKSRIDNIEHRMSNASNVSNVSIQKNHERSK